MHCIQSYPQMRYGSVAYIYHDQYIRMYMKIHEYIWVCYEVFDFLKIKKDLNDPLFQEDCTVIIDEIKMTSVHEVFDPSTCTYFGKVTLGENRDQLADNALVFLLAGLKTKWKQVVAFHFTSKNMVGSEIKPVLEEVIKLAENLIYIKMK